MSVQKELNELEVLHKRTIKRFSIVLGTVLGSLFLYAIVQGTIQSNTTNKKYPLITKQDSISDKVKYINKERGGLKIDMEKGTSWQVYSMRNYANQPKDIKDLIRQGDFIRKSKNMDTLKVLRYNETYVFSIAADLNSELRK